MARTTKSKKASKKELDDLVESVAEDAVNEIEDGLTFGGLDGDGNDDDNSPVLDLSNDVFEEGFKRCVEWKDSPRFHIKKNSQLIGFKDYPYSWERLFEEFGPGYYHVVCKGRTTGRIAKQQTEIIGDPNEGRDTGTEESADSTSPQDNNLAVLGWLQQSQERAEARARDASKTQENSLATVMQTVMTAQQQSQQTMMTLFMEQAKQTQQMMLALMQGNQQKGADPVVTLLTTLLTKEKPKDGMTFNEVIKLLQDKERDTRQAIEKQYEMIEKKADQLADVKAAALAGDESPEEESLSKTLLKAFMPVLPQIIAGGQQGQQFQAQTNPQLGAGFVERDTGTQAAIAAPAGQGRPAPRPAQARPVAQNPAPRQSAPVTSAGPNGQGRPSVATSAPEAPRDRTSTTASGQGSGPVAEPQVGSLDSRQKETIFNFVAGDIASAMMQGVPASAASEAILKKLEIEGITRQTVAIGFKAEDFYGYADQYIPKEHVEAAKSWLREFHESIQKSVAPAPVPVTPTQVIPVRDGDRVGQPGTVGAVPVKRGTAPRRAPTGTQSRTTAKNI